MNQEIQSWIALGIVLATLGVFTSRLFFRRKKVGGCPSCSAGGGAKVKVR